MRASGQGGGTKQVREEDPKGWMLEEGLVDEPTPTAFTPMEGVVFLVGFLFQGTLSDVLSDAGCICVLMLKIG